VRSLHQLSLMLNRPMRIPSPASIPLLQVFIFLCALLAVQLVEGTDPYFAVLMLAAQVFGVMAFNTLGGMSHVAGSFCLFSLLANMSVPEIAHAIVGQPGDFNLPVSLKVGAVCAIFYASLYAAARFMVLLPSPRPYLDRVNFSLIELRALSWISISLATYIAILALRAVAGGAMVQNGTTLAFLQHFYPVLNPLSVILATHTCLRTTQGRSAMNWEVVVILAAATVPGILSASKEGMLTPLLCWMIVCATDRYRFTRSQATVLAGVLVLGWVFVYPYSQNARDAVRSARTVSERISTIVAFIRDPTAFESEADIGDPTESEYGESAAKLNIISRFSLLRSNGMLASADDHEGFTGIDRYLPAFLEIIPHFLWPDRPNPVSPNELGHKAGFRLTRDDATTGIAIASPALFYDIGGWPGLPVYTVLGFGLFFYALHCLVGKAAQSVWGLMLIGGTAMIAGPTSPSNLIEIVEQFVTVFGTLVVVLKIVSWASQSLLTGPVME
jgi:hypothetical protein